MNFQEKVQGYWWEGLISGQEYLRIIAHVIIISEWDFERKVKIIVRFLDGATKTYFVSPKDLFGDFGPNTGGGCSIHKNESLNEAPLMNQNSSERTYSDLTFDSQEIDPCPNDKVLRFYPGRRDKAA